MLSVIMLSVIVLSVVMLNVLAPSDKFNQAIRQKINGRMLS
jgi:hypothetical protein